jgi:hypothetical protein
MPRKSFNFIGVKFSEEAIRAGTDEFWRIARHRRTRDRKRPSVMTVRVTDESWSHDSEHDFFVDYREDSCVHAQWAFQADVTTGTLGLGMQKCALDVSYSHSGDVHETLITVDLPERAEVEQVFAAFERFRLACTVSTAPRSTVVTRPVIFIGHGHSRQWEQLERHLRDHQKLNVVAYETAPRAGRSVKDVLLELQEEVSFAILVHTGEDLAADGTASARDNVIHETGLFQARLGWERAIILREDGCDGFSNISGINEIRYSTGNIRETFGEVLSTIRREFPDALGA